MTRSLVIVESPAKAKTINKYLGRDFIVKSSYGHIRDLPAGSDRETTDGNPPWRSNPRSPSPSPGKARAAAKKERARIT